MNPKSKSLRVLVISASFVAFALTGCVSTSNPGKTVLPVPTAQAIATFVQPITADVVPFVLNNNPSYAPTIETIADGITVAFGNGALTPTTIAGAIANLNSKANLRLDSNTVAAIASGLSTVVSIYEQKFGVQTATATDPGVQLLLQSFAQGLHDGVGAYRAIKQSAAAVQQAATMYFACLKASGADPEIGRRAVEMLDVAEAIEISSNPPARERTQLRVIYFEARNGVRSAGFGLSI